MSNKLDVPLMQNGNHQDAQGGRQHQLELAVRNNRAIQPDAEGQGIQPNPVEQNIQEAAGRVNPDDPVPQPIQRNVERLVDRKMSQHKYSFHETVFASSLLYNFIYYFALGWLYLPLCRFGVKCTSKFPLFHNLNMKSCYWFERITVGVAMIISLGYLCFFLRYYCALDTPNTPNTPDATDTTETLNAFNVQNYWLSDALNTSHTPEKIKCVSLQDYCQADAGHGFDALAKVLCFLLKDLKFWSRGIVCLGINALFVVVAQAILVGYINEDGARIITTKAVKEEEEMKDLKKIEIFDEENKNNELRNAFRRAQTHFSHLYFSFMPSNNEQNASMKRDIIPDPSPNMNIQNGQNDVRKAMDNERVEFERTHFTKETYFDDHMLCGYKLARELLEKTKDAEFAPKKDVFFVATVLLALLFEWYEFYQISLTDQQHFILYSCSFFFIIIFISDIARIAYWNLERRRRLMEVLGDLITPGEPLNLNPFDFLSLKTWMDLRRAFMRYADEQMKVFFWIMASMLLAHTAVAVGLLVLPASSEKKLREEDLYPWLKIFNGQLIFLSLVFGAVIFRALALNRQFDYHKDILTKNKEHLLTLSKLDSQFDSSRDRPHEPHELQNVFRLFQSILHGANEEQDNKLEALKTMYSEIIEDLESEEKNNSIKLFRLKISYGSVWVFATPYLLTLWDKFKEMYWNPK